MDVEKFFSPSFKESESEVNKYGRETEKKEKRGEDVKIKAFFRVRFEPKRDERGIPIDQLSTESIEQLTKVVPSYPKLKHGVKIYTGPQKRTQETGGIILGELEEQRFKQRIKDILHLPVPTNLNTLPSEFYDKMYREHPEFKGKEVGKRTKRIEYILSTPQEEADEHKFLSGEEVASVLAYLVDHYVKMTDKLKSDSEIGIENITHGLLPEAFLKEVLIKEDGTKIKDLDEFCDEYNKEGALIGGEAFEIDIYSSKKMKKNLSLIFRNKVYKIDSKRLSELVNIFKEKARKKLEGWK